MNTSPDQPEFNQNWRLAATEVVLVFAVFALQGAWPVPEVNEPYYLGKAIHFWNPEWVQGDFFLESADSHWTFYVTFGWLSLLMSPTALAWFGRLLTWGLMAWSWRRLSIAALPAKWFSVLSAALFVCLVDRGHMAGEWVVAGVEAKGFAFVLAFLGFEALLKGRWNRCWLLLGAASAFHVLVGGWSVVAAGMAWLMLKDRPTVRAMLPALIGGFALSLFGLVPALALSLRADPAVAQEANRIYVFERLGHHLTPKLIPWSFILRFVAPTAVAFCLFALPPSRPALRRLAAFTVGAVIIAVCGAGISLLSDSAPNLTASLLRFYWFRLADVVVPMAVALAGCAYLDYALKNRGTFGKAALAFAILASVVHTGGYARFRLTYLDWPPRSIRTYDHKAWIDICRQVAVSEKIPRDARFITPRMSQTFKWYAGRPEVANWKEIPQDAEAIVEWWRRIEDLHDTGRDDPILRWRGSLTRLGEERLRQLGKKYDAKYAVTVSWPPMELPVVFENERYVVYRLD